MLTQEQEATKKEFDKMDAPEKQSGKRVDRFNEGFDTGFAAAANDYANGLVNLTIFEAERDYESIMDFYMVGFETGYMRKLAEIALF